MTYEVLSTHSGNVLGTFDDERLAREAVHSSLTDGDADPRELVVYASDDRGELAHEFTGDELATWADAPSVRSTA